MSLLDRELSGGHLDDCLETLDFEATYNDKPVKVILSFVPFRGGTIDTASFLAFLRDHVITHFVLSYAEIQKHYARKDKLPSDKYLFDKAIRKFSKSTAKGKLGELLLYLFLEVYFNAPKILSKIATLDDRNTHVKGADAVHAQYVDGTFMLYLGESKLWQQYAGACLDAAKSMATTLDDYQGEFDLIETNIDFPGMSQELEKEILRILNPYGRKGPPQNVHLPCFIGFDSSICSGISSAAEYEMNYRTAAQARINTFFGHIEGRVDIDIVSLILMPFESVESFTDQFVKTLGVPE